MRRRTIVALLALVVLVSGTGALSISGDAPTATAQAGVTPVYSRVAPATNSGFLPGGSVSAWRNSVPGIVDVRIPSTVDGHQQPALWLPPTEPGPRPLLVALHSWSVAYDQIASIPYGRWARQNGWAMIHPDFRGVSNSPDATGSDLAVADIVDAVDWAKAHADIDDQNIYVIGFSGGGMMSLNMAGRHPEVFAGAVSWVPIYDLVSWYDYSQRQNYITQIRASCGGDPLASQPAREQCTWRSPRSHLDGARQHGVPVYIGHGLGDRLVLPEHAAWAFNHLADPADRLTDAEVAAIGRNSLPGHLEGQIGAPTHFRPGDPTPRFSRRSANTTMVLFSGGHNAVFNPGLEWMVHQRARSAPSPKVSGAVSRLYGTAFARGADASGLTYWATLYQHGRSLLWMANHFAASSEFTGRYGQLANQEFVAQVYRNVLEREPDAGGLAYWTSRLDGGLSRGWVILGFSQSNEMRVKTATP